MDDFTDHHGPDLSIGEQTERAIKNGLRCPPLDAEPVSDLSPVQAALNAYRDAGGFTSGRIRGDAERMAGEYGEVFVVEAILWAMGTKAPIQQAWARVRKKTWQAADESIPAASKKSATELNMERNRRINAECAARDAERLARGESLD